MSLHTRDSRQPATTAITIAPQYGNSTSDRHTRALSIPTESNPMWSLRATSNCWLVVALMFPASVVAGDWPQWRHDAERSGATNEELPAELHLQWKRQLPTSRPAWPEAPRLLFDRSYEPVVLGKLMFVPSNVNDSLTALDTDTGVTRWQFFADGPIRFAPAAGNGKVWFGSDDGFLYCLNAADGKLQWKFRGGPSHRKAFGNERLISMWPIRGGPVLDEGRIYFTAGIWPFMGIFAHSLDAETGDVVWTNDTTGSIYLGGKSGVGASPQGYLTAKRRAQLDPPDRPLGDVIIAPCGGSAPILFDQQSGQLKHFGGFVPYFADEASKSRYKSAKNFGFKKGGAGGWFVTSPTVLSDEYQPYEVKVQAGSRTLTAADCPPVEGQATSLLVADGKLFVVTDRGAIYCFGAKKKAGSEDGPASSTQGDAQTDHPTVAEILGANGASNQLGTCLILGAGDGSLAETLIRRSRLDVVVLERDQAIVDQLRRRWTRSGHYGDRVHVLPFDLKSAGLPPYLARLIVRDRSTAEPTTEPLLSVLFERLRPYGGSAALRLSDEQHNALVALVKRIELPQAKVRRAAGFTYLFREGRLPGSGSWTHEHGDAGNSLCSADARVGSPLGILWFGGDSSRDGVFQNDPVLIAGGRMFLYTRRRVTAVDVYTGRVLWKDGQRAGGPLPCYAAAADGHYSAGINKSGRAHIVQLDVETGDVAHDVELAEADGTIKEIRVWEKFLIATTSKRILAFDRHDLSRRWQRDTSVDVVPRLKVGYGKWRGGPSNHGLCVGGGKVFCIYGLTSKELAALKRVGKRNEVEPVLSALDIRTGRTLWHKPLGTSYLTWLAYSEPHDVLLQTVDFRTEQHGVETAYRGANGQVLWQVDSKGHVGPPHILIDDKVIPQSGGAYELLTGRPVERDDPLTGAKVSLDYHRTWHFGGCNYAVGSKNMLTFRNGTGGYCDLLNGCGTGFLGGDRTGCRNSLIVADGILNSPNISGCGCNFPIRGASMALIHDPQADAWTYVGSRPGEGRIERLGVNLGAPGDRKSDSGTVWLDHPSVGGPSPQIGIQTSSDDVRTVRVHASKMTGDGPAWVAASGLEGLTSVTIPVVHFPRGESFSTLR